MNKLFYSYMTKNGGDATLAKEEIWKYYTAVLAEVTNGDVFTYV